MFKIGDLVSIGERGSVWDGTRGVIVRNQGADTSRKPMVKLTHVNRYLNDGRLAAQMRPLHVGQSYAFPQKLVSYDQMTDLENIEDTYEID